MNEKCTIEMPRPVAIEAASHGGFVVLESGFSMGNAARLLFAGSLSECCTFVLQHFAPAHAVQGLR